MPIETLVKPESACTITKPKLKLEHKVRRYIRRAIELVKPTHCRIRYDTMQNKWAVLTDKNTVHHHFAYGVMVNVKFAVESIKGYDNLRCANTENVGVATGDLRENYYGNDGAGFSHLSFNGTNFIDENTHVPIKQAQVLRLMSERRALYK